MPARLDRMAWPGTTVFDAHHWAVAAAPVPTAPGFAGAARLRLGGGERRALDRIRHGRRRAEWIAARVLLKELLGGAGGRPAAPDEAATGVARRVSLDWELVDPGSGPPIPRWRGRAVPHAVSLSHAGGWVLAGVSRNFAIGLDVEPMGPRAGVPVLRYGSAADRAWLSEAPELWRAPLATLLWTLKESALKTGLAGSFSVHDVLGADVRPRECAQAVLRAWLRHPGWHPLALAAPCLRSDLLAVRFRPLPDGAVASVIVAERVSPVRTQAARKPVGSLSSNPRSSPMNAPFTLSAGYAPTPSCLALVKEVFVDVVRYPAEIFEDDADLETDLGVDSVKLGEVLAVLRERFDIPDPAIMAERLTPERVRTIGGIAAAIDEFILARDALHDMPAAPPRKVFASAAVPVFPEAAPCADTPADARDTPLSTVIQIFADVTRYPADILDPTADLETDLGIDSVKLGEIFAVLRERFDLPPPERLREDWPADALRTIEGIAAAIASLGAPHPTPAAALTPTPAVLHSRAPDRPFAGKVALVTGSGRGLGKAFAMRLAELGAEVVVNSFHSRALGEETAAEITAAGGRAHHVWASVANPAQMDKLFDDVETSCGGLDFFVSNASNGMLTSLDKITAEHWEKAFRTNVVGLHLGALRAAEMMKRRGGGRIVTLSTPGATRYLPYFACMGPVKAAVESLTRFLAIELEPHNIRVNCVSAGPVYGDLVNKWPESAALIPRWESITAGNRLCNNDDVVEMVMFLLGEKAVMMNGSVVVLDGGQSVRCGG